MSEKTQKDNNYLFICNFYKICNFEDNKIYVGSTKSTTNKRFSNHKCIARKGSNALIHKHMRELGVEKFYVELIESKEVNSREEQLKRETKYIVDLKAELNQMRAYTSYEKGLEIARTYKLNHPEKMKENRAKYYQKNGR